MTSPCLAVESDGPWREIPVGGRLGRGLPSTGGGGRELTPLFPQRQYQSIRYYTADTTPPRPLRISSISLHLEELPEWSEQNMRESLAYGTVPLSPKHKNTPTGRTTVGQHTDCNLDTPVRCRRRLTAANHRRNSHGAGAGDSLGRGNGKGIGYLRPASRHPPRNAHAVRHPPPGTPLTGQDVVAGWKEARRLLSLLRTHTHTRREAQERIPSVSFASESTARKEADD